MGEDSVAESSWLGLHSDSNEEIAREPGGLHPLPDTTFENLSEMYVQLRLTRMVNVGPSGWDDLSPHSPAKSYFFQLQESIQ